MPANVPPCCWRLRSCWCGARTSRCRRRCSTRFTPAGFLFVRYLVMPVCAALLWQRYGRRWPRLSRARVVRLARLGILGPRVHVGLVTFGIHWSTAFSSSLILALGPVFTLLLLHSSASSASRARRWPAWPWRARACWCSSPTSCSARSGRPAGGDLVLLVAAALFSAYTVAAKPLIERHGGVLVMAYATAARQRADGAARARRSGCRRRGTTGSPAIWAGLLWAVVVSAFFGWLVWGWVNARARRGPHRAAHLPDAAGRRRAWRGWPPARATARSSSAAPRSRWAAWRWRSSRGAMRACRRR